MSTALRYLSVCSGIEAATVAWHPLGWQPVAFAEIDRFPAAVLAHHYPTVPNWGDLSRFHEWPNAAIDLLVGGTPCQSFSVAGLRKGLDDPRGSLLLTYLAIARRYRPRWLVWENVPGVLSIDGGRAFGSLLGGLAELGYGFAYRVLDAQYFGLAQRRARVFVVGHLGDWRRAAAVLFERHSLSGHSPPRRETRQDAPAGTLRSSDGGSDVDHARAGHFVPEIVPQAISAKWAKGSSGPAGDEIANLIAHSLRAESSGKGGYMVPYTLAIRGRDGEPDLEYRQDGTANAVLTPNGGRGGIGVGAIAIQAGALRWAVRRLTPRECERLQGFPDDSKSITIRVCRTEDERRALARSAALPSTVPNPDPSRPVAVDALIDLERQHLQLRSLGRSNWSASFAGGESSSPLSMPLADFARLVAATTSTLARETGTGAAASLLTINRSSAPWDGSAFVHLCGREIEELANDAERFTIALSHSTRFITSEAGRNSQSCEQTWRTLCSCVAAAIASSIPDAIRASSSYDLRLTTLSGYTLIPYRGKPAADGPRYKALGNSMAVPVMRWIGDRIALVERVLNEEIA